jgi:two-component system phosphate regulon sensor histidine kinase PhoR
LRQSTDRIRRLTKVIHRIIKGERSARLLPQSGDDIGDLLRAFNRMVEENFQEIAELTEKRRQLAMVLAYMADGVLIIDRRSYVQLINPAACRLLETTEERALGHTFAQVVRHHQLIDICRRCQKKQEKQIEAVEVGRELFLQVAITPFAEEEASGYLVILQDLTTVRRLETVRRDFISNISHELRTPLASLRAVVETLQDSALEDPPAARRFLGRAERELDTMTQMVEELLELARIESGKAPLRLAPTAVSEIVSLALERLRAQAERSRVTLHVDLPPDLPPVLVDDDRVQQVMSNLLHNAIKFTPEGGHVIVGATPADGDMVQITVQDTGVGIPAKDLPRIFERFYKSDRARTRRRDGTGLGLAISRHIVQAHNGRIWVHSREGQGSAFYFTLPAADQVHLNSRV